MAVSVRITSARNERVQRVRRLVRDAGVRRSEGACIVEGVRAASDYVLGSGPLLLALISPRLGGLPGGSAVQARLIRAFEERPGDLIETTDEVLASVADARAPQGILLVVPMPRQEGLPGATGRPLLVAWQVQDPGNLGSLVRTAEASGCAAVIVARGPGGAVADPFSPRALRGAAGSGFRLPIHEWCGEPAALAQALRSTGCELVACAPREGVAPEEADLRGQVAFLVGSEGAGLPEALTAPPCQRVTIPLAGAAESLNAAAAAAIVTFEAARQRRR